VFVSESPSGASTPWPITIPRRQTRALLFRLAAALQPVPRDHLAFVFWPDSPDAVARRNLTVLLAQLRRALPSPDMLVTTGDAIALNPARVRVDTAALAAAIPGALGDQAAGRLAEAVRLYRGPFLEGFALADSPEFEAWAGQERQAWERRYMDARAGRVEHRASRVIE
jgi:DNA-binding SARP family transcriptional activator